MTNGGKHAVYNTFATLLDPGDEVLLPAPYWTTYPEPIRLAGGVPVELPTDERSGFRVTVEQLEAARTDRTKALVFVSPSNPTGRRVPAGRGRGHRPLGGRARHLGHHRRDLRAPHLRRRTEFCSMPAARARAGRPLRGAQRRGQDLRHDRLARRVDDRSARRHQGRHQPAVPRHLERGQRQPARPRWPRSRGGLDDVAPHARGLRPARQDHVQAAERHRGRDRASSRRAPSTPSRPSQGVLERGRSAGRTSELHRSSWPTCCSRRPRWPSSPARPSAPPATPGCPSPSATTTWARASAASATCWPK